MDAFDLLKILAQVCERLQIRYVAVGSVATIAYGEPRFTNDVDLVLELSEILIDPFCESFPEPEYYLSRIAVENAVRNRRQFNIINTMTSLKADCIIPASPFDQAELSRGVVKKVRSDFQAVFAAPEDVILKKLEYFRIGESDKHIRDIVGLLKVSGDALDMDYLQHMATQMNVADVWKLALARRQTA